MAISTFGFLSGGHLNVTIVSLKTINATGVNINTKDKRVTENVAFILEKTKSSANSLLMDTQGKCALNTLQSPDKAKSYEVRDRELYRALGCCL